METIGAEMIGGELNETSSEADWEQFEEVVTVACKGMEVGVLKLKVSVGEV